MLDLFAGFELTKGAELSICVGPGLGQEEIESWREKCKVS
jgi:hypothetical protein